MPSSSELKAKLARAEARVGRLREQYHRALRYEAVPRVNCPGCGAYGDPYHWHWCNQPNWTQPK